MYRVIVHFLNIKHCFWAYLAPKPSKKHVTCDKIAYITLLGHTIFVWVQTLFGRRVCTDSATLTYIQTMKEYTNQTVTLYFWTYGMAGLVLNALLNDIWLAESTFHGWGFWFDVMHIWNFHFVVIHFFHLIIPRGFLDCQQVLLFF